MKKLFMSLLFMLAFISVTLAQDSKIMVGASGRLFGPLCTNCSAFYGGSVSGAYSIINRIVAGVDVGFYSRASSGITSTSSNVVAIGLTGDFYPKGSFKGFFVGPDLTLIQWTTKSGSFKTTSSDFGIGANLGWAITAGRLRIIPHFGYGTWYEGSKGRLTAGLKVGFTL